MDDSSLIDANGVDISIMGSMDNQRSVKKKI